MRLYPTMLHPVTCNVDHTHQTHQTHHTTHTTLITQHTRHTNNRSSYQVYSFFFSSLTQPTSSTPSLRPSLSSWPRVPRSSYLPSTLLVVKYNSVLIVNHCLSYFYDSNYIFLKRNWNAKLKLKRSQEWFFKLTWLTVSDTSHNYTISNINKIQNLVRQLWM